MRRVHRRFLIEWVLMFVLLPSAIVWLDNRPGLFEANAALYDRILQTRPPTPSDEILIVGIDKRSIDALGDWPFPRSLHARLLDELAVHAPRSVLLDVFFDGPASHPHDDELLAEAMRQMPVYLPLNYLAPPLDHPDARATYSPPVALLARHARGLGHANATPDADGLVRTLWRYEGTAQETWPYIGLRITDDAVAPATGQHSRNQAAGWLRQGRFGVPFAGPEGTYPTVSYVDALRGHVPSAMLHGKVILVGAVSNALLDDTLPVAGIGALTSLPGVEIHANAVSALLRGQAIDIPAGWRRVLWISMPIWIVLVLFLRAASHAVMNTLAMAGLCIAVNTVALVYWRVGLPLASPLVGIGLAYLLWSWRRMSALLVFFRERADALNAVPSGAFEPPMQPELLPLDSVERRTRTLDRAIDRLTRLQSLLTEGVWQLPVPVLICRADGIVSQSNAAAQALLADGPASTWPERPAHAGDPLQGLDLPHLLEGLQSVELPQDAARPHAAPLWERAMASEFTTRQGNVFRLRAASLDTATGSGPSAWIVVLPDITLERRAQREREQWFGFLSHDLRSPQVTILNLLALHAEGAPNVDTQSLVDGIGSEARRTLHLTESFMDMVEAESGVYRFEPCVAGAVVLDAIDAIWPTAQTRGLTVTPRLGPSDASILADHALLTRALVNLLNNAIRASDSGTTLHVCLDTNPNAAGGRSEAVISIRDEGSGMTPDQVARAMRSGERRKASERRRGHGWGIGMAIVHAVIARHGGWLDVMSAPGEGTTFLIGLPLAEEEGPTGE